MRTSAWLLASQSSLLRPKPLQEPWEGLEEPILDEISVIWAIRSQNIKKELNKHRKWTEHRNLHP